MNEITTNTNEEAASKSLSVFASNESFELAQRAAKLLSASDLVPESFRGSLPNCLLALNIAQRLGADPFSVLQNVSMIRGKPSWSASFLIGMVNSSGRFTPLQFRMTGEGDDLTCVAHAKCKQTGEPCEGPPVSIRLAKSEGWYDKPGSKWKGEMAPLMLRYRAGAFFSRIYAPDLTLGMRTAEEEIEIRDVEVSPPAPLFEAAPPIESKPEAIEIPVVQEEKQESPDPKAEALTEVLQLITQSQAKGEAVEAALVRRQIMGKTGSIARLGQAKLEKIRSEWIEIESEALNPPTRQNWEN
tara:strand:+ start:1696 stop:2595 length:900 start_codon:yes stop_codon:yes gene_type:complete